MGLRILKSLIDDALVRDEGTPDGMRGDMARPWPDGLPKKRFGDATSSGERLGDMASRSWELYRRESAWELGLGISRPSETLARSSVEMGWS